MDEFSYIKLRYLRIRKARLRLSEWLELVRLKEEYDNIFDYLKKVENYDHVDYKHIYEKEYKYRFQAFERKLCGELLDSKKNQNIEDFARERMNEDIENARNGNNPKLARKLWR